MSLGTATWRWFGWICAALTLFVSFGFLAVLSRAGFELTQGISAWLPHQPKIVWIGMTLLVAFVCPVGVWGVLKDVRRMRHRTGALLLGGLLLWGWLTSVMIVVDYLGAYPSILAGTAALLVSGGKNKGLAFWATFYAANAVFCVVVAGVASAVASRHRAAEVSPHSPPNRP